jgi:hypothetical protein
MAKNLDYLGDTITYDDLKKRQKNPNTLEMDVIAGSMYIAIRKTVKEQFRMVYTDLLTRIADDYQIDLDELKENYPLDIKVFRKKNVEPAQRCQANNKKTSTPCQNARKQGHNYCGIHLRSKDAPSDTSSHDDATPEVESSDQVTSIASGIKFKKRVVPSTPTYNLREETDEEKEIRRLQEEERKRDIQQGGTYKFKEDPNSKTTTNSKTANTKTTNNANTNNTNTNSSTNTSKTTKTHNDEEVDEADSVDVLMETIEGVEYLTCGDRIYEHPGDLEDMGIDDLTEVGQKLEDGTVKWY